ncbi:DUF2207 domain-containing protein [Agromyces sp. LHK192]|uniref:DUF2207 domain-containing protein n=1 Tax=Agromyces sp. LHK192 TaxID=2498704 RepID=UPI001F0C1922|nr:DUF2207 domain-containing protein [Agromyces sp. LHK192]
MPGRARSMSTRVAAGLAVAAGAVALAVAAVSAPAVAAAAPAPVAAAYGPGAAASAPVAAVAAGVDDFTFASFTGDYALDRDAEGRSTLTTTETLVAQFPEIDQNRGIRRNLVDEYDGHPTGLQVESVTDEAGAARPYEEERDGGIVTLTIAADDYVHGTQTYVITYTQRDVTRYYADTDADEFYWDVNGTDWAQPFGVVTANVHLGPGLAEAATGGVDTAAGTQGSTGAATAAPTADGWTFEARELGPHQTLTFAIGFEAGTFIARDDGFLAAPWPLISVLGALVAVLAAVWAGVLRATRLRDEPGRPVIVPEYLPPEGVGVLLGSVIAKGTTHAIPAQILQLAVLGRLQVVEVPAKGWFASKPSFELQYQEPGPADELRERQRRLRRIEPTADDVQALHALFGATLTPGERRELGKADAKAVKQLTTLQQDVGRRATSEGYRGKLPVGAMVGAGLVALVGGLVAFVFAVVSFDQVYGGIWPLVPMLVGGIAVVAAVLLLVKHPLRTKGAEVRDHLAGLELYIRMAEADRLAYLQSPAGALRTPVAADDPEQVLQLDERLLPWAVLLGQEKAWTAELGRSYERMGRQPDWYSGSHLFNAAVFSSAIGGMSSSVTSTYSASSGGSGGGASAGGGGGGGGGGGV